MSNLLISKLKACTPQYYKLVWDGKLNEPIRHKINTPNLAVDILNNVWTEILAKYTGSIAIICDKYTRLNVNNNEDTIAILVYPNGTIMYQGNTVVNWAESNLENICKEVQVQILNKESDIKYLNKDSSSHRPTDSSENDKLLSPTQTTLNIPSTLEPLDLSIGNQDSSSRSPVDSPVDKEQMNKSCSSELIDSSSSLEFTDMNSFLDSSESSLSPELKSAEDDKSDHENTSHSSPSTKANCKRSLNFDNLAPFSDELNISNQRYPARLSVTPDPSSSSIRSYDSFCNNFPPSGKITLSSSTEKAPEQPCTETLKPENEINAHTQTENMMIQIQKLEQEKCNFELEIKSLKERLKYCDATLDISKQIDGQKTQPHRLDHRSPTVIIKEFKKMEEVLKVTQQKLHDSMEEKKKLNQQISSLNMKGQLPTSADINRIPEYLQLKSDYDRLCGRQKILELKHETESKKHMETNLKLTEECETLRLKLKQEENTIINMNEAYELANDKIEEMSTGKQKLFDEIETLKRTITSLQSKINEMSNGWESIDSSSTEEEVHTKKSKGRKKKSSIRQSLSNPNMDQRHIPLLRSPQRKTNSNHLPNKENDSLTENGQQNLPNHQQNSYNLNQSRYQHEGSSDAHQSNNRVNPQENQQQFYQRRRDQLYHREGNEYLMRQEQLSYSQNHNDEPQVISVIQNRGKNQRRWDRHNGDERLIHEPSDNTPNDDDQPQFIPVIKNRGKNAKRKYHQIRKQNRPDCPFLKKNNYCPSERCLYWHPKHSPRNNEGDANYEQDPERRHENSRGEYTVHQSQRTEKRNITCKFHLQNRCLYGRYCNYRHTETNQYP